MAKVDFYNRTQYHYVYNATVSAIQIFSFSVDMINAYAINIHASIGPTINHNIELDLQESDDNINFTPINKEQLIIPDNVYSSNPGVAAIIDPANKTALIGYRGKKRYIEIKSLVSTGTGTTNYNIVVQKLHLPDSVQAQQK